MKSHSVTEAIYDAGFNSSGRFYEKSNKMLGMTPTQFRTGGANEEIRFAIGECTLGAILVASSKKGSPRSFLATTRTNSCVTCRTASPGPN